MVPSADKTWQLGSRSLFSWLPEHCSSNSNLPCHLFNDSTHFRQVTIYDCPKMKTLVQQGISVRTPSLKSVNNDDEVKVVDLNKAMFNSKVSCPNLEELYIIRANSISALCSHQLPTAYFSELVKLEVSGCEKLRNLMSPSVAGGLLILQELGIRNCLSMEEVITEEEQQGEGIMTLFPLLEQLNLRVLPKLRHFFLTEQALEFPFLWDVLIDDFPEMKTFVQQGISVSAPLNQKASHGNKAEPSHGRNYIHSEVVKSEDAVSE